MVRAKFRFIGLKRWNKAISLLGTDLTFQEKLTLEEFLQDGKKQMIDRVKPWKFSGRLMNSFVVSGGRSKQGYKLQLQNTAPYASALEGGVKPFWMPTILVKPSKGNINNIVKKRFTEWARRTPFDLSKTRWIKVGSGPNTNVKKGASKRAFMRPVMTRMISDGTYINKLKKGSEKALNLYKKRTRG